MKKHISKIDKSISYIKMEDKKRKQAVEYYERQKKYKEQKEK